MVLFTKTGPTQESSHSGRKDQDNRDRKTRSTGDQYNGEDGCVKVVLFTRTGPTQGSSLSGRKHQVRRQDRSPMEYRPGPRTLHRFGTDVYGSSG